jgi:heterodisulfide reductase subunit A
VSDSVLVIGGGIAGIQASLDLAEAGARVVLVEREASIGGVMAVLDKNFPTLDCSICIEAPKMSEVELHPNIEIISLAEVDEVTGKPGDFRVSIRQQARYVTDACTRCGECSAVCPVSLPNEFDSGMASRKAIYTPIPQSTPGDYLVDIQSCLNCPPNYLPCNHCSEACLPGAIDFLMPPENKIKREVGAVIVAVGYGMFDPRQMHEYGYGDHVDILTAMEFERLVNSAGPTGGEIIKPSNGDHPDSILFVLCVGSRDRRFFKYCSRFCCMYSIKHAYQAVDHGVKNVTVMYMDVRSYGKGFDGFWERTASEGVDFVRGRPARISGGENGNIRVVYESTDQARRIADDFDMVVLANAVTPPDGLAQLANVLGIDLDEDGYLRAEEHEGALVTTTRLGIYAAGCASGPKDIPDSVSEGSAAAALSLGHLTGKHWPEVPEVEFKEDFETERIGVFVCHCGSNIAGVVDVKEVVEFASSLDGVEYASDQMFSCAGNTQREIEDAIKENNLNRVVIAACSPKTHESIFRGVMLRSGLNPFMLEMANIRNMDSWVHKNDPGAATRKALDMVFMAVEKARFLTPLEVSSLPLSQRVLVIGGGIAGMTAAAALSRQGLDTHLVERNWALGGMLNQLGEIYPSGIQAKKLVKTKSQELVDGGVHIYMGAEVERIGGVVGNFQAQMSNGMEITVGAVVIATGFNPYQPKEFGYRPDPGTVPGAEGGVNIEEMLELKKEPRKATYPEVITNLELEQMLRNSPPTAERITFIACVGSRCGDMGCSRYCCTSMIGQALHLRQMGKKVRILYKEIRTYSRQSEELYESAMRAGVQFFQYDQNKTPQDCISIQDGGVTFYDHLLGVNIDIPTGLLVLVSGLRPTDDQLAEQLKLARSEDGFYMELHPKLGPVETAVQGVYLAGAAQGAKDVRESMAQALAAAGKTGALLSRGVIEKEPLTAKLIPDLCIGCMRCVKVCPFGAIEQIGKPGKDGTVNILEAACMGCGTCAAECNFEAIEMPYFTKEQILAQVDAALAENAGDKCLVFTCNWCSYAGADLAGIEKRQYPASTRIIRTMCSARFEEGFISHAFEKGAGAVLITGCRLTETGSDCHYNYANKLTLKRFEHWQRKFSRKGIDADRLQLRWISAAEGKEFAEKMYEMDQVVKEIKIEEQTDLQ